jgi:integrase/recombinase XerD
MERANVYRRDFGLILQRHLKAIEEDPAIAPANKELVLRFCALCRAEGLKINRLSKTAWILRKWAAWMGPKDFATASKADVVALINTMASKGYRATTMLDYRAILKKFFKYGVGDGRIPDAAAWIKVGKVRVMKDPATMLSEDDVARLLQGQESQSSPWVAVRNKALIAFLYDSGVRIGELAGMRLCDISVSGDLWLVTVTGKTGQRTLPIFMSIPYLRAYLAVHPRLSDRGAPVWCGFTQLDNSICYASLRSILRRAFKRAGVKKPANPHNFRHSAVSRDATFMSDQQLKAKFGWTAGSQELQTYSHVGVGALETTMRQRYGLASAESRPELVPKACLYCGATNEPHRRICQYCAQDLAPTAIDSAQVHLCGAPATRS